MMCDVGLVRPWSPVPCSLALRVDVEGPLAERSRTDPRRLLECHKVLRGVGTESDTESSSQKRLLTGLDNVSSGNSGRTLPERKGERFREHNRPRSDLNMATTLRPFRESKEVLRSSGTFSNHITVQSLSFMSRGVESR